MEEAKLFENFSSVAHKQRTLPQLVDEGSDENLTIVKSPNF
jgi:hypothetical protein